MATPARNDEEENIQEVPEYSDQIFEYMLNTEGDCQPNNEYMEIQTDINEKMRAILIDWLVEVHLKFKLLPETMFLTTNIIDRFLGIKKVS